MNTVERRLPPFLLHGEGRPSVVFLQVREMHNSDINFDDKNLKKMVEVCKLFADKEGAYSNICYDAARGAFNRWCSKRVHE